MKQAILMVCLSTLVLKATAADAPIPKVEVDFHQTDAGEWSGKRLSEMVTPDSIKQIILTHDSWMDRPRIDATTETRTIYDALMAHRCSCSRTQQECPN